MSATQLDAVRVLTGIIRRAREAGLPPLAWRVEPADGAALTAQPNADADDDRAAVIAAWAAEFGAEVRETEAERYTAVDLTTEVDGVAVRVFTHVGATYEYVQVSRGADRPEGGE